MEIQNQESREEEATSTTVSQEPQQSSYAPEFDEWVKEKPRANYIRLKTGEPKVIHFKSGKPNEMLMSDFGGKSAEPKPVARYLVTTPEEPNEEKSFDVTSKRLAAAIEANFARGITELEITKLATNPVSYQTIAVIAREKQKQMATGR